MHTNHPININLPLPFVSLKALKRLPVIPLFAFLLVCFSSAAQEAPLDFFGEPVTLPAGYRPLPFAGPLSVETVQAYAAGLNAQELKPYLQLLLNYKATQKPDDWLYYQLVRRMAQRLSPKADDYHRYTLYKWWFLVQSGYDARLTVAANHLLFYVQCDENIYNIPVRTEDGRQYVCLNYHDYGAIDFNKHRFAAVPLPVAAAAKPFSYKVTQLPDFRQTDYTEKDLQFSDGINRYAFRLKVNTQVKNLFTNYPVVDYGLQFNTPLSRTTYESFIPALKKELKGLKQKEGVAFLMRFTRYAFLFKPDTEAFGDEKRLSPEQTLLSEYSDCEDRAALFFFLVKEIYNLPMLVLTYPDHVTVAVGFDKAYGKTIEYDGRQYSICEPSPQRYDLNVGQLLPELQKQNFKVAFAYQPR